ncbi:amino acid adenylation domain-containing protein, partial [Microbulbifer sp. 2201CG32-9]|uniref:amino acid adenylation domain-containing protein n=1 Tax=Microbulbifer sp. 2201CG32-9 TaxID=3232309 RepID=UPI00345BAF00
SEPPAFVHQRVQHWVEQSPDAIAVTGAESSLTYGELNRRADALAQRLLALGVSCDDPVALYLPRGEQLVVAILAVLKCGAGYLPLNSRYPVETLVDMLAGIEAKFIVSQRGRLEQESLWPTLADRMPALARVLLDDPQVESAAEPVGQVQPHPDNLAFCIFTSGSTGKPKPVAVTHRGFSHLMEWYSTLTETTADSNTLLITATSFDLSQKNIFLPLINGNQLHLADDDFDPDRLLEQLRSGLIDHSNLTPSAWFALAELDNNREAFSRLDTLVLAGEPIDARRLQSLWSNYPQLKVINYYGPSECTDASLVHPLRSTQGNAVIPAGKSLPYCRNYIVDQEGQLMPEGLVGELYIGGIGVARGYYGRAGLTADRFYPDPFSDVPGARMYRTGDLARYGDAGDIVILGRCDQQIKLRGFRIELGEVEAQLRRCTGVEEAVVSPRTTRGDTRLVAFLKLDTVDADTEEQSAASQQARVDTIASEARDKLPGYMLPAFYQPLEALPLNAHGKIDR